MKKRISKFDKVVKAIPSRGKGITAPEIAAKTGISEYDVRDILQQLEDQEAVTITTPGIKSWENIRFVWGVFAPCFQI